MGTQSQLSQLRGADIFWLINSIEVAAIREDPVAFSPMLFLHLHESEFFKLSSKKLWLFLEFDCLKNDNGNGKVRESIFWKNFRYHYVNL